MGRRFWKSTRARLGSMRLAVVLLTLITLAAIIGGIVPQASITPNAGEIYRAYGPFWYRLITRLALDDVFHSAWFFALLSVFAVNLVLCTTQRLRGSIRRAFGRDEFVAVSENRSIAIETTLERGQMVNQLMYGLRRLGFRRIRQASDSSSGKLQLVVHRFRWSILGADLVHLGILVILIGGLLGVLRQEGTLRLNDWEVGLRIPACGSGSEGDCVPLPFDVQVDDFGVELYPESGRTRMFWADLSFWRGDELVDRGRTAVNRPYSIRGVGFYPWRYGADVSSAEVRLHVFETQREMVTSEIILRVGETITLPNVDLRVSALRYFQTFALDDSGQVVDLGNVSGGHSAVLLQIDSATGDIPSYRDLALPFLADTVTQPDYVFILADARIPASMQIHYVRSPGYRVVWVGFLLVMIGLAGALYFAHVCLRLTIDDGSVMVTAESRKARAQLGRVVEAIRVECSDKREV